MSSKRFNQRQLLKRPFKIFPKGLSHNFTKKPSFNLFPSFNFFTLYNFKYRTTNRPCFIVLRAAHYGYISDRSIEAFRKVLSPYFRKKNKTNNSSSVFYIRSFAYMPLTKKPSEVRIGGGKGAKLRSWILPVYPGKTLFEIFFINRDFSYKLFYRARKKLGVPTTIVFR